MSCETRSFPGPSRKSISDVYTKVSLSLGWPANQLNKGAGNSDGLSWPSCQKPEVWQTNPTSIQQCTGVGATIDHYTFRQAGPFFTPDHRDGEQGQWILCCIEQGLCCVSPAGVANAPPPCGRATGSAGEPAGRIGSITGCEERRGSTSSRGLWRKQAKLQVQGSCLP